MNVNANTKGCCENICWAYGCRKINPCLDTETQKWCRFSARRRVGTPARFETRASLWVGKQIFRVKIVKIFNIWMFRSALDGAAYPGPSGFQTD